MKLKHSAALHQVSGEEEKIQGIQNILASVLVHKSDSQIQAIRKIMNIPYDRVENHEIKNYLLASANELKDFGRVFYMNSCLPRTLLLIDELRTQGTVGDIQMILDVYVPIREDYTNASAGNNSPTIHAAVQISHVEGTQTVQFFDKKRIITPTSYENPEKNMQRVLPNPLSIPIQSISPDHGIKDILHMGPTENEEYRKILETFDILVEGVVDRLKRSNTVIEFKKETN